MKWFFLLALTGCSCHDPHTVIKPGQCYTNSLGYTYKVLAVGEYSAAVCSIDTKGKCEWSDKWEFDYILRQSRTDCTVPQ